MYYRSTRDVNAAPALLVGDAILRGQALDGGLYWPCTIPHIEFDSQTGQDPALQILAPLIQGDDRLSPHVDDMVRSALGIAVPLVPFGDAGVASFLLELFHGPTAAFKDFGARFLAACFSHLSQGEHIQRTILVATSGDTGGAVAAAFHHRSDVRVVILFPDGRVSPLQAHQLSCWGDNIISFAVQGTFDECQSMVKQAFADPALVETHGLTSANSINIGRLLPQMSYYVRAAVSYNQHNRLQPLGFVVPTGNMGNVLAALLARAMGAPIGPIVIATNRNDTIPRFLQTGIYDPSARAHATPANAMDVAAPSNLERARILFPGETACRNGFRAFAVDDESILHAMRQFHDQTGMVICPHTACGAHVLAMLRKAGDTQPYALAATAHAAKFSDVVERALGSAMSPALPPSLQGLLDRPAQARPLAPDLDALRIALQTI